MEENSTIDNSAGAADEKEMKLCADDKFYLIGSAKWAEFISIVNFVFIGLCLTGCLIFMLVMGFSNLSGGMRGTAVSGATVWGVTIAYIVGSLIAIVPTLYLYRYARKTKMAIATGNESEMTEAFDNMYAYMKFNGILLIISLALIFVGFILLMTQAMQ